MMGWGEFFALAAAISWAVSVILFRKPGFVLPAFELNLFKNVLAFLLFIPTLLLVEGIGLPDYSAGQLLTALVSGFLGIAVADTWYLRALNLMGASRTGIVSSLLSPFVVVLSVLQEVDAAEVKKGAIYAVASVFMMAVGVVMVKDILENQPFIWTVELRLLGGLAGMVIYITARGRWRTVIARYGVNLPWWHIVSGSVLGSYVAMMLWLAGYKLIPASVASILNESANAWIVVLAWLILGEALGLRKVTGLLLTMAGVAIMLLV
jgi:drug/metabolite transporter (DMT)-like permease